MHNYVLDDERRAASKGVPTCLTSRVAQCFLEVSVLLPSASCPHAAAMTPPRHPPRQHPVLRPRPPELPAQSWCGLTPTVNPSFGRSPSSSSPTPGSPSSWPSRTSRRSPTTSSPRSRPVRALTPPSLPTTAPVAWSRTVSSPHWSSTTPPPTRASPSRPSPSTARSTAFLMPPRTLLWFATPSSSPTPRRPSTR